jgi:hypothetical protein
MSNEVSVTDSRIAINFIDITLVNVPAYRQH